MENGEILARGNGMLTSGCFLNRSLPAMHFNTRISPPPQRQKLPNAKKARLTSEGSCSDIVDIDTGEPKPPHHRHLKPERHIAAGCASWKSLLKWTQIY